MSVLLWGGSVVSSVCLPCMLYMMTRRGEQEEYADPASLRKGSGPCSAAAAFIFNGWLDGRSESVSARGVRRKGVPQYRAGQGPRSGFYECYYCFQ